MRAPTLVEGTLLFALLVVVPLAVTTGRDLLPRAARAVLLAATVPAAAALLLPRDAGAGALALAWVLATSAAAVAVLARWWRGGRQLLLAPWVAAHGYLAVGGLWLLADRIGYEPAGFGPPFVQLTAVHFTYAGFVTTALATSAWRRYPTDRVARTAVGTTVAAPPLVAVGFLAVGVLQIVGALLLTVGTYALAWVTLRRVVPTVGRPAAWLLGISSVSVLVPMLLAVQWAVGANLGTPALSIPDMARTHGLVNAVGFAGLGALGWALLASTEPARRDVAP